MSERPTPETDAKWQELCCSNLSWYHIAENIKAHCQEKERERDEAREQAAMWKANHDNQVSLKAMLMDRPDLGDRASRIAELIRERDEAREQVKELREALLRVRTWGVSSKNFSATDSYKMAEWIDDGCEGELPKPDGPWIYEKMEETK